MTKRALVLGSGGFGGIAWELGVLHGLREDGFNITDWDLVVGTSAGAFVGARLLSGGSLDSLYAAQTAADFKDDEERLATAAGTGLIGALRLARRRGWGWVAQVWFVGVGLDGLARYVRRHGISELRHLRPVLRIRRPGADSAAVLGR